MHKTLPADRLHWIGVRFRDRNGRTFEFEGEFYRAIYPEKVGHVRGLFESGLIERLTERGWLIESKITDLEVPGFGLVLHHRRAPFAFTTGSHQWTRSLLLDAARTYLDLNLELAMHGFCLTDGHSANFGQIDCCRPVWLDFGSIVPLSAPAAGLDAFRRHFSNPLRLLAQSSHAGRLARTMIREGGINDLEVDAFFARPELIFRRIRRAISVVVERVKLARSGDLATQRQRVLEVERARLPTAFPVISTRWAGYHKNSSLPPNYENAGPRREAILQIMQRERPRQVIDLACNAGYFSFMAARQGAEAFAVDYDEGAVEKLYEVARECSEPLWVTSACFNLTRPNPTKPQGELVLALALTHHLSLGQFFPWEYIAANLAGYSTRTLLVEFMPNGLGAAKQKQTPLPDWYTLETFMDAFQSHFQTVEVVTYPKENASPRTLVLCRGRKTTSRNE